MTWPLLGKRVLFSAILAGAVMAVTGCGQEKDAGVLPPPIAMTEEAIGKYCGMNLSEHAGPKAQIHLVGIKDPIWFSQVRDAVVYLRLPEETYEVAAVYVNDMGKAQDWDMPGNDTWINARDAYYVIGSRQSGGMGAPETIPFGRQEQAEAFISQHGGALVRFDEIPDSYVLEAVELKSGDSQPAGEVQQ